MHPALPAPRLARRLPSHSSLRIPRQWPSNGKARPLSLASHKPGRADGAREGRTGVARTGRQDRRRSSTLSGMRPGHELRRRHSSWRRMASVRDVAVLVRYFMSTAVSIPPTITIRADSIMPATGGDRTDLRPHGVPTLITRRWRAFPAQRPLFHCRSLAEPIMFASCGKPKRRKRARALHKAHSSPANLPASSFNPASMRSATERTQYCTPDLTEASRLRSKALIGSDETTAGRRRIVHSIAHGVSEFNCPKVPGVRWPPKARRERWRPPYKRPRGTRRPTFLSTFFFLKI